jgi:ATP-binding cassette subfamily F protein uup
MVLLLAEPNVLLLDEPTNDLDIETLTELEDLLDGWPGSVVAVSHDRYFLERVTDHVVALVAGKVSFLPGGVDEYLELRDAARSTRPAAGSGKTGSGAGSVAGASTGTAGSGSAGPGTAGSGAAPVSAAQQRAGQKELVRLERQIAKLTDTETRLGEELAGSATDYARLLELGAELKAAQHERATLEERWLALAEELAG